MSDRRQRIHELVLALLAQQKDLELLDGDATSLPVGDAGNWLERNRRVVLRYQALVRSAVTLDALVDQDVGEASPTGSPGRVEAKAQGGKPPR
jgi:hypothetical protein